MPTVRSGSGQAARHQSPHCSLESTRDTPRNDRDEMPQRRALTPPQFGALPSASTTVDTLEVHPLPVSQRRAQVAGSLRDHLQRANRNQAGQRDVSQRNPRPSRTPCVRGHSPPAARPSSDRSPRASPHRQAPFHFGLLEQRVISGQVERQQAAPRPGPHAAPTRFQTGEGLLPTPAQHDTA